MCQRLSVAALVASLLAAPALLVAQTPRGAAPAVKPAISARPWPDDDVLLARRNQALNRKLFQDGAPLEFTLTSDFSLINGERTPNNGRTVRRCARPSVAPISRSRSDRADTCA